MSEYKVPKIIFEPVEDFKAGRITEDECRIRLRLAGLNRFQVQQYIQNAKKVGK